MGRSKARPFHTEGHAVLCTIEEHHSSENNTSQVDSAARDPDPRKRGGGAPPVYDWGDLVAAGGVEGVGLPAVVLGPILLQNLLREVVVDGSRLPGQLLHPVHAVLVFRDGLRGRLCNCNISQQMSQLIGGPGWYSEKTAVAIRCKRGESGKSTLSAIAAHPAGRVSGRLACQQVKVGSIPLVEKQEVAPALHDDVPRVV